MSEHPPSARLLMAPGCAHCPAMIEGLTALLKTGKLGRLEIINVAAHPEQAAEAGTRSVPWTRIGAFDFEGVLAPGELAEWVQHAARGSGMPLFLEHLLKQQQLPRVVAMIREQPERLGDLVALAASLETAMVARIGIGAVIEEFAGSDILAAVIPQLGALTRSEIPQVRADACHYLALSGAARARQFITALLDDADAEVREIAAESLPMLTD